MDLHYLMRRMAEERLRASESETEAARDAHLAMAEQYRAEIERLSRDEGPEMRLAG